MGIVRIMGTAAAAGLAGAAVRRRVDGVLEVRRSVAEYREHWQALADSHAPHGGALRYVALGDSAAQGVGASTPSKGYVPVVADAVAAATGRDVALYNLSVSGAKATDILEDQLPRLADLDLVPDLLTLDVGGNDVIDRSISPEAFAATMALVLAELPPGSYVADVPGFWLPPFRGRSDAMAAAVRPLIAAAGHHVVALHRTTTAGGRIAYLRNVAGDVFHPNDQGYAGWAGAFLDAIRTGTNLPAESDNFGT